MSGKMHEIEIDGLDEETLLALHARIVERLHLLHQQETAAALQAIKIGSRVMFETSDGRAIRGIVIRRNRKTMTVHGDDEKQWNVSPSLLRLVGRDDLDRQASKDGRVVPFAKPDIR
jgi:hypothetical protein